MFDTAWLYNNEGDLGAFLQSKSRNEYFITSKLHFNQIYHYYSRRLHVGLKKKNVLGAYNDSCQRLEVKQIDLYLLHAPFANFRYLYNQISKLFECGKVKAIGVSNFSVKDLELLLESSRVIPAVNQIEINPLNCNRSLIEYCNKNGIVVEAFSPFGRGLLTKEIMDNPVLLSIAKNYDKTVAQVVLRWLTQQGIVAIPRSNKIEKIKQNIAIFDFSLNDKEIDEIYDLNRNIHTVGGKIRIGND
jgi:diketogulonate reductase-like aldo/keto reductase